MSIVSSFWPHRTGLRTLFVLLALLALPALAQTRLLRYPDLHGDRVAFTYGGDLWAVSAEGGVATRLTAHPGLERFPKFSPDGRWIAFTGQYDGDEQVYVIPAGGGVPRQLTFYPALGPLNPWAGCDNQVMGWTPDGRAVLFRSMRDADGVLGDGTLYTIALDGGPARRLPMVVAGTGAFAPDGKRLAYEPIYRDFSNWKRYEGGRAQGIYVLDLATSQQLPLPQGRPTDQDPMWIGDQIYFTSDRNGTLNLYRADPGGAVQLTFNATWDVRWPSSDHQARIVYERVGALRVFNVKTGLDQGLHVTVPTDGGASRPLRVDAEVESFGLSPRGERALFVARGDVFSVPIENGPVRNLTQSPRAHDKLARWSPDGRTIAFVSDQSGEENVYLVDQEGKGKPRALTTTLKVFLTSLAWAPDGAHLALGDKDGRIFVAGVADRKLTQVAKDIGDGDVDYAWSPDGRYLAVTLSNVNGMDSLHIWSADEGLLRRVTPEFFPVRSPAWDPQGNYLYYLSRRTYATQASNLEMDYAGSHNWGVFALALRRNVAHPFPPESDEVTLGPARAEPAQGPPQPLSIDWEGLAQRAVRVPVVPGSIGRLVATPGHLLYRRLGLELDGHPAILKPSLCVFDLKKRRESVLADDVQGWEVSADGTKVLVNQEGEFALLEARAGARERKVLPTRSLKVDTVPAQEWAEVFDEVWRRYRDFFYVKNMHGYDWHALGERYRPLLKHVTHRSDLTYVLSEMVGELNVGHAFLGGGDYFRPDRPKAGLPGAQFTLDEAAGRYRLSQIYRGQNEEPRYRSPLTEVGVDARVGDYVLAIDGQELTGSDDPYRMLRHKTSQVTLTLNEKPVPEGARQVAYTPLESETSLRYLDFVLRARERVATLSGGRLGYLHLPDMGEAGLAEFVKWYYPQIRKEGLVVDVRANAGGSISQMILERLSRRLLGLSYSAISELPETYPDTVFHGPMVCLLSETTSSDGEIFAYHFRKLGLGPLIGKRTWGGAVGYTDTGPLLDGGFVGVPMDGTSGPDGQWIIEGDGVHPDVEVENDPKALLEGRDPQLERAVAEALKALARNPKTLPPKPPEPVKTK